MTRRYYHPDLPTTGGIVSLSDAELQHARVMRLVTGDVVELFDGKGSQAVAEVIEFSRKKFACKSEPARTVDRENERQLHLAIALPKPDRARELIERLTELGVVALTPIIAARTQRPPKESLIEKLRRGVIEACKQSRRNVLLKVHDPLSFNEFLTLDHDGFDRWIAHPDGLPIEEFQNTTATNVIGLIGPEGGWTDEEVEQGRVVGFQKIGLGKRILRIETAAAYMAARLL